MWPAAGRTHGDLQVPAGVRVGHAGRAYAQEQFPDAALFEALSQGCGERGQQACVLDHGDVGLRRETGEEDAGAGRIDR